MIIVMTANAENLYASKFFKEHDIQVYPELHLEKADYGNLILFDLNLDEEFGLISPRLLVDELVQCGLPAHLKKIKLLVGCLNLINSVTTFAQLMVDYFAAKYDRQIKVFVPTNINYKATLIVPPDSATKEWLIYGSPSDIDNSKHLNAATLIQYYPHFLLWRGRNIDEWMEDSTQREFRSFLAEK